MRRSSREEPQSPKEPFIKCKHCGRQIINTNYLIHEARCALMSSKVYRSESQEKPEIRETKPEYEYPQINPNFRKEELRPRGQPRIFNNQRSRESQVSSQEERIPCHFCGYKQTLAELDTHPLQCEHREEQCPECNEQFPRSLMQQHMQVCGARRHRYQQQHQHHHNHHQQPYYGEEEEIESNYNPFGNFAGLFNMLMPTRQRQQRPQQMQQRQRQQQLHQQQQPQRRHQRESPQRSPGFRPGGGFLIIERTDQRGNRVRQVIPSSSMQEGFSQQGGMHFSPFNNFFALLQMMAARQGRVNQGLTKEQIRGLKRTEYQGNNQNKSQQEKDLCTICYCEFEKGEKLITLKCNHQYHEECITKWVQTTAKCPVCKTHLTNRDIFNEDD